MKYFQSLSKAIFLFIFACLIFCPKSHATTPTDIVINEFMADPSAVSDTRGEWIELFNSTANAVNLNGWNISDLGSNSHTISEDLIIQPGAYLVLGRSNAVDLNGGMTVDYVYSSFTLANTSDAIILTDNLGNIIDQVEYDTNWAITGGASLELIDANQEHNNPANWAIAKTTYGDGDFGTPGNFNSQSVVADITPPTSSASVNSGMYYSPQSVVLSAIEPEKSLDECTSCQIYYTLDGSTPTTSSLLYTSPLPIHLATTLKFFAVDETGNIEKSIHTNYYMIIYLVGSPFNFHGEFGSGAIALSWETVPNAQSYQIYRSTNLGRSYSYLGASTETHYLDQDITLGQSYKYRLIKVDSMGNIKVVSTTSIITSN